MTIPTIEPAYHLWCELSNAVEDFVSGVVCAKMTREEPRK
jgi:hypothetical protein